MQLCINSKLPLSTRHGEAPQLCDRIRVPQAGKETAERTESGLVAESTTDVTLSFKNCPYFFRGKSREKGRYLPLNGLGLVLAHECLHFTQLQL